MGSINIIIGSTPAGGIGYKGDLPWPYNKSDMEWFKKHTLENVVVMGRNTYDSIGRALPERINYCITTRPFEDQDLIFEGGNNFLERIKNAHLDKDIFLIGGANLIEKHMDECDKLYLTLFDKCWECDTFVDLSLLKDTFKDQIYMKRTTGMTFSIREKI